MVYSLLCIYENILWVSHIIYVKDYTEFEILGKTITYLKNVIQYEI